MLSAFTNQTIPLEIVATDGRTDLYGRVYVFDAVGTPVTTLDTTNIGNGLYLTSWTPVTEGFYSYVGQFFIDVGRTIDAGYERDGEQISVDNTLQRLVGIHHENSVLDQQSYDVNKNLLSARLRQYDSKTNAQSAGATGLLHTWTINASYLAGLLVDYRVYLEP